MNFEQYTTEDLLQDDSFVNYCLERNPGDVQFWRSFLDQHPHKRAVVAEAVELYFVLNGNITREQYVLDQHSFNAELTRYKRRLKYSAERQPKSRVIALRWLFGAAAAALIAAVIITANPFGQADKQTGTYYTESSKRGERRAFQLPDGSSVILNSGSTIALTPGFNNASREVLLNGEAFFDVSHMPQKPFVIKTKYLHVRVLGTVFNVKAYQDDDYGEAALIEGSVEVTLLKENNRKVVLKPNEKILYSEKSGLGTNGGSVVPLSKAGDASAPEVSWTKNRLAFDNESFTDIAHSLERWFNVNIRFNDDEVSEYRFTATFEKKTIEEVLEALKLSRDFKYTREDDNITIGK